MRVRYNSNKDKKIHSWMTIMQMQAFSMRLEADLLRKESSLVQTYSIVKRENTKAAQLA